MEETTARGAGVAVDRWRNLSKGRGSQLREVEGLREIAGEERSFDAH